MFYLFSRSKKPLSLLFAMLVALSAVLTTFGQPTEPAPQRSRPKIGLVLSGGGARGFAHIGVLKVLEENRIPVDYIGGASMGALIGALYAMGKSPAEIEQIATNVDWDKLLSPRTSFDNLSFRRKEDARNIPAPIVLKGNIKDLKLPNALNSGHEIALLFDRVTLPYALVNDFDKLPIPFRAVGTDMVNGDSVTLKSGSLSHSLRATMSIPGVFSPVEIDGRILADGGLVNNIPTDVVKAMGADIILVVNIETKLGGKEVLESLPGVLSQTINVATAGNSKRSLREADLIIAPDLGDYTLADFTDGVEIIQLGYNQAKSKETLLKGLSLDEAAWDAHLAARKSKVASDEPFVPEFLSVEGKNRDAEQTIKEKLGDKYTGKPLNDESINELAKDLTDLTGTGRFDQLNYEIVKQDGKTGLEITTNQPFRPRGNLSRFEIGFDVNSVESDNTNFNFLGRLTIFDVGRYGAELRNDLRIGSNTFIGSEYYRPIGETKFFVAPRASYERRRLNLFIDGNRITEYVGQTFKAGADVGYSFNKRSELRLGYTIGRINASRRIGDPIFTDLKGNFQNVALNWVYDGLDKPQVPTDGIFSKNSLTHHFKNVGVDHNFTQAQTRNLMFKSVSERSTLFGIMSAGATFGGPSSLFQSFTLGGPFQLGGYGFEEFRSSQYWNGGVGVLHNPKIIPTFLGGKTYVGAWYEGGSAFETWHRQNYRQSVTGGAIIETPLGPIFVGTSFNEEGRGRFYFSFGRIFR